MSADALVREQFLAAEVLRLQRENQQLRAELAQVRRLLHDADDLFSIRAEIAAVADEAVTA